MLNSDFHKARSTFPIFRSYGGTAYSLKQLAKFPLEVVHGEEATGPSEAIRLPFAALDSLRRLLPEQNWRHWRQPPADEAVKKVLLRQPQRRLRLPEGAYLLRGEKPCWVWGVSEALTGWSVVRILYQGRPAGVVKPDWPLEVAAELAVDEIHLTPRGELRIQGEVEFTLQAMFAEIQASLIKDLAPSARLRLSILWLRPNLNSAAPAFISRPIARAANRWCGLSAPDGSWTSNSTPAFRPITWKRRKASASRWQPSNSSSPGGASVWAKAATASPGLKPWTAWLRMPNPAPSALPRKEAQDRLRELQEHTQDDWRLLRRGLELLCHYPVRLLLVESGPLLQIQGESLRLNRQLAGLPTHPRTAALLSLAAHELKTQYSVTRVLSMLQ